MKTHVRSLGVVLAGAAFALIAGTSALAADKTLRVGAPLPMTGPLAAEGERQRAGYKMWADAVNARGGIKAGGDSYKIQIVEVDYQSNTPRAVQAAERLINEDKVDALFAPFGSGATKAVSAITEKYGVPMIAPNAASEQVYDQGFKYLFGMYVPNKVLTESVTQLVRDTNAKLKRLAILTRNDLFPIAVSAEMEKSAKKRGFDVVFDQKFPIGTVDFGSSLTQMRSANPDWIFVAGYLNDLILIRKQIAEQGVKAQLLTMVVGTSTPEFIIPVGALAENMMTFAWWDEAAGYTSKDVFGSADNFVKLYADKHKGQRPDYSVASSAACGVVLQMAIEKAGTTDKAKVRDQLAALEAMTFFGPVKFGPTGQITSTKPPVLQIQGGKPVVVYPPEIKKGDVRFGFK